MKLPPIIDAAMSRVPRLRLPPFMDAGDIGAGVIITTLAAGTLVAAGGALGLAWAVFKLAGGL